MSDNELDIPEGDAPPAGGIKAKLPLILAVVAGLALGGGTGAVVVGPVLAKKMGFSVPSAKTDTTKGEHGAEAAEGDAGEGAKDEHGNPKGGEAVAPPVLLLENLVLNPASSGGSRYLLMSIAIEATDAKTVADLTARDAELKDLILTTLSKKTVEQLSDVTAREGIKTELIGSIKERFGKKTVKQLYFPQFVIQ